MRFLYVYTSDQPCWTGKANTNNNHNKWLHEFLISLRWGYNSLLCRCCHLTTTTNNTWNSPPFLPRRFLLRFTFLKTRPKRAWQGKRTQLSLTPFGMLTDSRKHQRSVLCSSSARVRESPTRQKPRLLNKKKENSDFLPSFCEIPLHL